MRIWNTLSKLTKLEIKRLFNKSFNIVLMMILGVILINVLFNYDALRSQLIKPSIGVVVEDDSMEVNILIDSVTSDSMGDKLSFEYLAYDEAIAKLKSQEILAVIHVEEGLGDTINRAEPVTINLFVDQHEDLRVQFLREYIDNLSNMLNEGQNGAMIYYQLLKDHDMDYEARIDELNSLAFKYTTVFLGRQQVFDKEAPVEPFMGADFIHYYLITVQLLFIAYTIIMYYYIFEDDLKYKRIDRLSMTGHSLWIILISKVVAGWVFTLPIMIFLQGLSVWIGGDNNIILSILYLTWFHVIIQAWVVLAHLTIKNRTLRDGIMITLPILHAAVGGLIIPLNGLPSAFSWGAYKNVFSVIQMALLGSDWRLDAGIAIVFMTAFPVAMIYKVAKERNYVFF